MTSQDISKKKPKKRDFDNIPKPPKPSVTAGGKTTYLTNKDLVAEIKASKLKGKMSDTLAAMLQLLCSRYARRAQFAGYSYNEDMQAFAMYWLVKTWSKFNDELYTNAFAFYTQCIKNSFRQFLNQEKRHRTLRDMLLVEQGMNPSFGFADDYDDNFNDEDHAGFGGFDSSIEDADNFGVENINVDTMDETAEILVDTDTE